MKQPPPLPSPRMTHTAVAVIIIDGLSDTAPHLRRSRLPTLDALATRGRSGLIDPVAPGLACGSDVAHLALFGYEPRGLYRGRGAFEAMGGGLGMAKGDVAFKCNFAVLDAGGVVVRRCAGKDKGMEMLAGVLCAELDGFKVPGFPEVKVAVRHAGGHRLGVKLSGEGLCDRVSNTDPLVDERALRVCEAEVGAGVGGARTAAVVNAVSGAFREYLAAHGGNGKRVAEGRSPANVVLFRGAGERIDIEDFNARHCVTSFLIAPTKIIAGVGLTAGIEVARVKGATGHYNTNLQRKAEACAERLLQRDHSGPGGWAYNIAMVHIKAVDEAVRDNATRMLSKLLQGKNAQRKLTTHVYVLYAYLLLHVQRYHHLRFSINLSKGHDRDARKKVLWLERVDAMVSSIMHKLIRNGRRDIALVVTGDHTTPASHGDHTCEPVPIIFADAFDPRSPDDPAQPRSIHPDACSAFDEVSAGANGSLGRFPAQQIMPMIRKLLAV